MCAYRTLSLGALGFCMYVEVTVLISMFLQPQCDCSLDACDWLSLLPARWANIVLAISDCNAASLRNLQSQPE